MPLVRRRTNRIVVDTFDEPQLPTVRSAEKMPPFTRDACVPIHIPAAAAFNPTVSGKQQNRPSDVLLKGPGAAI